MRDHETHRGGNVGLTDQTTSDLYGIAVPLHSSPDLCALNAGKDVKSLSGGCREAKPPTSLSPTKLSSRAAKRARTRYERRRLREHSFTCSTCGALFEGTLKDAFDGAFRHTSEHPAQHSLLVKNRITVHD